MPDRTEFPEAEQERAQALIRCTEISAPPALRARLEAQIVAAGRDQRGRRPRRELPWRREPGLRGPWPRTGIALTGLAAAAVAAIVLVVIAIGARNTSTAPSIQSAVAVALRAPTTPAPSQTGDRLDVSAGGIRFPYWQATVGWRAIGTRADTIHGRRVVTVFYTAPNRGRVGYSIVAGSALSVPAAPVIDRRGIAFSVLNAAGATVVTWLRAGHTCVMASRTANPQRLIDLATSPA